MLQYSVKSIQAQSKESGKIENNDLKFSNTIFAAYRIHTQTHTHIYNEYIELFKYSYFLS